MNICFLGTGTWGFCLASLLASKGYQVLSWTTKKDLAEQINRSKEHPLLPGNICPPTLRVTTDLEEALNNADMLIEAVTSAGLRPVFEQVKKIGIPKCPIVITSKGIEQDSGYILPDVVVEVLGEEVRNQVGCLSGPSFAKEVIKKLPTSVVCSAYQQDVMMKICEAFTTPYFRVYPNSDILGVAYGGALKNIIAIACGAAEGLDLGYSAKAALMTRGLHEIRKLAVAKGCKAETINGLSGMGDMCLTCSSLISRNFKYGYLIALGLSPDKAMEEIAVVVEGAYTCTSALQLSQQLGIPMPITEIVYQVIHGKLDPKQGVSLLMQRNIKEEHL